MKCHLRSGSELEIDYENSSFYRALNRFLYSHLVCCCIVHCDFQEFLCTVTCIKNLLLSNLNDKPQRHLTLNHIENNCYHPYNHLLDNGRPFVVCVRILPIPVSPLNMQGLFVAELLATYSRAMYLKSGKFPTNSEARSQYS